MHAQMSEPAQDTTILVVDDDPNLRFAVTGPAVRAVCTWAPVDLGMAPDP